MVDEDGKESVEAPARLPALFHEADPMSGSND